MQLDPLGVLADTAAAVDLAEGEAGVMRVLRALAQGGPTPTKDVARAARLPLPLATAVLGELRSHGYVDTLRPAQLTARGVELAASLALRPVEAPVLADLTELSDLAERLDAIMDGGPEVDVTLDQSFATTDTKLRRVLHLLEIGALPTPHLLLIGDDDLVSVAVDLVQRHLGVLLAARITVVDVAQDILDLVAAHTTDSPSEVVLVRHDAREPLPADLAGTATVATTDPPYTTQGARLFLERAVEGLRAGPGWDVVLHYGPKPPGHALDLQRVLTDMELVVREALPAFSRYHGAGVIGGVSTAFWLEVASSARPEATAYDGPLYTADLRDRPRRYVCATCATEQLVGKGQAFATVGVLKDAGCPQCGGTVFRPGTLAPATPSAG